MNRLTKPKTTATLIQTYCFGLLISLGTLTSHASNLPELGAPDLISYDHDTEQQLGNAFTMALHTQFDLNYDPEVIDYIRRIGQKVTSVVGNDRAFSFYVLQNNEINAFAGPNGVIGIHTGLIEAVKSEDELASVIAHEIAHVTQRHLSRRYEYQSTVGSLGSFASILAGVLVGMHDPNAGMATLMSGMSLNIEQQLKNSRQHESEADHYGISYLHKAGYNPHAMGDFFGRLAKNSQYETFTLPEILRTHPVSQSRLAEAENRAQSLIPFIDSKTDNSLLLIQMRLALKHYNSVELLLDEKKFTPEEQCYQNTLLAIQKGRAKTKKEQSKNTDCMSEIAQKNLNQPLYASLFMEALAKNDRNKPTAIKQQIDFVDYLREMHSQNLAIQLRYTDILAETGQFDKAINLLNQQAEESQNPYLHYQKLATLYEQRKQTAEAYFNDALAQFDIGNLKRAHYLIKQAKKESAGKNINLDKQISVFEDKYANMLKNSMKLDFD